MDALAIVLKNFTDDFSEASNPLQELDALDVELLIPDIMLTEKRIEKLDWAKKRGQTIPNLDQERELMDKILQHLEQDRPLRELEISDFEKQIVKGYNYLFSGDVTDITDLSTNCNDHTVCNGALVIDLSGDF